MKFSLALLIIFTLMASPGYAGFFDSTPNQSSQWSWQNIKEKISAKWNEFKQRFSEPEKVAKKPAAPITQPAQLAAPAPEAPAQVAQQAPAQEVQEKAVPQKAQPVELRQPASPVVVAKPQSPSWFSRMLNIVRGTNPPTEQSVPVQGADGVSVPVAQTAQVQENHTVAVNTAPAAPSFFERLKAWFTGPTQSAVSPEEMEQNVPQNARIQNAVPQVKALNPSRVAQPGVPFNDTNLILGHNGIPVFRFKSLENKLAKEQIKKIPRLNVGQEAILDSNTFKVVELQPYPALKYREMKALEAPEVASTSVFKRLLGEEVEVTKPAEKIDIPILEPAKKVTGEKIAKLVYKLVPDVAYTAMPVVSFTEEDLKLLRGLILFEKKDQCHIASGIFSDLLNAQKPEVVESSHFHLGVCLHVMNLPTEALHHLAKTIKSKNPQFAHDSIKAAVEDIQLQYENEVVEAILAGDEANIPKESLAQVNYLKAKFFIRKNQPKKALEVAIEVPYNTPQYYKAQYVASVAEYEMDKTDASLLRQKNMATELSKNGKDKDVLALFEMNLGRASFEKGKYKDSMEAFQRVPKENSLWIQSLMEEAWVQLQSKDMAGAIGNMHSIQSPYFNGVYKPESYVLRSIAYLSICQYPDAFKSIMYLEHVYQPWLDLLKKYNETHDSAQAYDTVLKQLRTKSTQDIDGLPYQAIREAARQRDFLNAQEAINQLIDESSGYSFIRSLIEKDKKSLVARRNATIVKIAQLKEKIKKVNSIPDGAKNYNAWRFELANLEDFLAVYEFKVATLKEGLDGLNLMTPPAQKRIADNKEKMKGEAGKALKSHFVKLAKELRQNLDNDELLKYEVYAGSGENLRYKIAGGKTGGSSNLSGRAPAGMHWDFDGEYWEDEIGNYRSSLKNNCQNAMAGPSGAKVGAAGKGRE